MIILYSCSFCSFCTLFFDAFLRFMSEVLIKEALTMKLKTRVKGKFRNFEKNSGNGRSGTTVLRPSPSGLRTIRTRAADPDYEGGNPKSDRTVPWSRISDAIHFPNFPTQLPTPIFCFWAKIKFINFTYNFDLYKTADIFDDFLWDIFLYISGYIFRLIT